MKLIKLIYNGCSPQTPRLARCAFCFSEYEFDLQQRPGQLNTNADALSQNPEVTIVPEVDPLMDLNTCTVLCYQVRFLVSPVLPHLNLLPTDTLLAVGSILPV